MCNNNADQITDIGTLHIIRMQSNGTAITLSAAGQWRRQRSKGAMSFRDQNILEPGHPDALFSSKKLTTIFFSRRP